MKLSTIKDLFTSAIKEGAEVNLDGIDFEKATDGFTKMYNDGIKAEKEKAKEATKVEIIEGLGFKDEKELKKELEKAAKAEENETETIKKLQSELDEAKNQLNEKNEVLTKQERMSVLSKYNVKEDKVDKAYKLINSELQENEEFEDAVKRFAKETPEWLDGKPSIDLGEDGGEDDGQNEDEATKLAEAWG